MEEEYRTINSTYYLISNFGNVVSTKGNKKLLKKENHRNGYHRVCLMIGKKKHHRYVHRLVAEVFLPNDENKAIVNHIDCNKKNNHITNLEWVTESENTQWYHKNKNAPCDDGEEF